MGPAKFAVNAYRHCQGLGVAGPDFPARLLREALPD